MTALHSATTRRHHIRKVSRAQAGRILLVEDEPEMRGMLETGLVREGFDVVAVPSAEDALSALTIVSDSPGGAEPFDAVLSDLQLGRMNGLELCDRISGSYPGLPFIVMTGWASMDSAVGALRAGAFDYIAKPVEIGRLIAILRRAADHVQARVARLPRPREDDDTPFAEMVCESAPMRRLCDLLKRVADTDASVLITGESGTGKEVVARALHNRGSRREQPFVAINCAAMPEALLESQLFGHIRGAFTDARQARTGLLARANGGTLFLDEIGDMPISLQPKLLRALQERCFRPVGGDSEVSFDVRLIAATNRDLDREVTAHRFRMDLYFRINVIRVEIPPLRTRGRDVLLLAKRFLEHYAKEIGKPVRGLSQPAMERVLGYRWPGNVRELQNCIEHAVALTCHEEVLIEDLPPQIREYSRWSDESSTAQEADDVQLLPVEVVERHHILKVLDSVSGNKTLASRILGLDRKTLYRKLKSYQPEPRLESE